MELGRVTCNAELKLLRVFRSVRIRSGPKRDMTHEITVPVAKVLNEPFRA